jgi:hypothetical protein
MTACLFKGGLFLDHQSALPLAYLPFFDRMKLAQETHTKAKLPVPGGSWFLWGITDQSMELEPGTWLSEHLIVATVGALADLYHDKWIAGCQSSEYPNPSASDVNGVLRDTVARLNADPAVKSDVTDRMTAGSASKPYAESNTYKNILIAFYDAPKRRLHVSLQGASSALVLRQVPLAGGSIETQLHILQNDSREAIVASYSTNDNSVRQTWLPGCSQQQSADHGHHFDAGSRNSDADEPHTRPLAPHTAQLGVASFDVLPGDLLFISNACLSRHPPSKASIKDFVGSLADIRVKHFPSQQSSPERRALSTGQDCAHRNATVEDMAHITDSVVRKSMINSDVGRDDALTSVMCVLVQFYLSGF